MSALVWQVLHLVLIAAVSPLVIGLQRFVRARLLGRVGPPPWQPYRDLARLAAKQPVVAEGATGLFTLLPAIGLLTVWLAASLIPLVTVDFALAGAADLIALVGLLALSRVATALVGLDIGTAFGGLGASRDMMIGALAEPALLVAIFTLALVAGTTDLVGIVIGVRSGVIGVEVSLALVLVSLVLVALAENGRIPVDNPTTHLELTMVHEAMVLEQSGRHLALTEATRAIKLTLSLSLIGALFAPWGIDLDGSVTGVLVGLGAWIAKLATAVAALALVETIVAKMRVFRVAEFLGAALLLALLATVFRLVAESF
ncbi:MAG: NADH-quinone oxidoreductase subunit H [Alphaproteobacteria bacterium]|nr:NADH-quinone oxidoreductase subunit H [Alphaproteobacteria bacterium]